MTVLKGPDRPSGAQGASDDVDREGDDRDEGYGEDHRRSSFSIFKPSTDRISRIRSKTISACSDVDATITTSSPTSAAAITESASRSTLSIGFSLWLPGAIAFLTNLSPEWVFVTALCVVCGCFLDIEEGWRQKPLLVVYSAPRLPVSATTRIASIRRTQMGVHHVWSVFCRLRLTKLCASARRTLHQNPSAHRPSRGYRRFLPGGSAPRAEKRPRSAPQAT